REALGDPGFNRGLLDEILATVGDAARAGEQSVNRLLTFSRSQQVVPVEPVDLRAMLQEAVQLTAPRWHDAALGEMRVINVSVEVEGDVWVAGWPPGLLNAFVNLIQNAADALPRGGTVSLTAQRRGEEIVAEVADDGTGIAPEVLPRIFEPFFSTKGGRGTGIGLTQVSRVVALHQGKVEVDTVPGQGTTVRLVLPAAVAPVPVAAAPETDEAPLQSGALRILAVDDEEGIRLLMAAILEPLGHAVVVVGSGEAALTEIAAQHFDLVISDIGMGGGMNGWELAEQVRTRSPGTRFLLATGWGSAVNAGELDAKGVDGILTKPYNVREFQRQVALVTASP
ncbi:MAG: ATP-binding protein, partial [Chloroflexota bacterium]|nr:ATP-binding protein [Chloroflexota bacterium]